MPIVGQMICPVLSKVHAVTQAEQSNNLNSGHCAGSKAYWNCRSVYQKLTLASDVGGPSCYSTMVLL
jgi:hypothetical protein